MGKIKKILENELVGGTQSTDVYPVTSVKAVYDENNERLDHILNRRGTVNISTNYNSDHTAEVLTLSQAIAKVPASDRVLGFQGNILTPDGWKSYRFTGDSITLWENTEYWDFLVDSSDIVQESGNDESKVVSQRAFSDAINSVGSMAADTYRAEEKTSYHSISKGAYYSGAGKYTPETYNAYAVSYYKVSEGEQYLIQGTVTGNNVAGVVLLDDVGSEAAYIYDVSKSLGSSVTINRLITIPAGINYIGLSVPYSSVYGISVYEITSDSRITKALKENEESKGKIKNLLSVSDYIMPATNQENLMAEDTLYLDLAKALNGEFEFSSAVSAHEMSRLISVKPNTLYTLGYVYTFYEWDKDFNIINTIVNSTTYEVHTFTTQSNTAYISIKTYINSGGNITQNQFLIEGVTSDTPSPAHLNMSTYKGARASFTINQDGEDYSDKNNIELYRGTQLKASHTDDGFVNSNLVVNDTISGWKHSYFPVEEGEKYLIKGYGAGNKVAVICLASNIGVFTKAILVSPSLASVRVEQVVHLESSDKYIVLSYAESNNSLHIYKKDKTTLDSRLDKHDSEIAEVNMKFTTVIDGASLTVDETVPGKYYSERGIYLTDTYNKFNLDYYHVEEGQKIHLTGKSSGYISMFALLADKGTTATAIYGLPNGFSKIEIDIVITIPPDVNWLARSYNDSSSTIPYLSIENDHFDWLDSEIARLDSEIASAGSSNKWRGKRLLAIGDSITSQKYWQKRVGELLSMEVRTHAKGGIGIIQMVDGDGSGDAPEGYDPDSFGTSTIYKLNEADVTGVDIIILMGFYNTRNAVLSNKGELTDMYPNQNTWYGQMNYAIKRVYEELENANNSNCKVVLCSAHKYGKYPYIDKTAYEDGDPLLEATKDIANRHSLFLIDLMHNGNINMYNWDKFQNSSSPYNPNYIPSDGVNDGTNKPFESLDVAPSAAANSGKYITIANVTGSYKSDGENWVKQSNYPFPWNGDQLHLNQAGGYRLGDYIAGQLLGI